jgi:general secretion pathway protein I
MSVHVPASSVRSNFKRYFPGRNREAGFTLLEILVAFIIAAIALAVLFGGAMEGLRASRTAVGYEEAVARARSHLAAARVTPLPGDTSGDDGSGYRWRLLVRAVDSFRQPQSPQTPPPPGVTLYAITVWISWRESGRTREVRLDSESLVPDRPTSLSPAAAKG